MLRRATPLALLLTVVALTGCTATPTPAATSTASSTPHRTFAPGDTSALYGKDAMFLSAFVKEFPASVDQSLLNGRFILEKAATAPGTFDLPAMNADDDALVLTIFCDTPSPYEIAVIRDGAVIDKTSGASCGEGDFSIYTTAPLAKPRADLQIATKVDAGTSYRVSIQETESTTGGS